MRRMSDRTFVDSNVWLYLLSADETKADRAEQYIDGNTVISVQVLNEVTNVARRKLDMSWDDVAEFLGKIRSIGAVEALTVATHDRARSVAQRYGVSFYDASIIAAALIANCRWLATEDLQHGMVFEKVLTVVNPFSNA